MGAVGGMLGLNGGMGGTGFNAPSGTNSGQIQTAYQGNQNNMAQQQSLLDALKSQNGLQNQSNVYNQLQGVVSGQGPNPAQAMLNQSTGANVANQAALMAGQRGAGNNVGLMARQAGQTGANLQQQAAGQGASMQAQQSLGALGQAGNMAGSMAANQIGQTNANTQSGQNEQSILQNANNANNNIQGQLANTSMQGGQGLLGGLMGGASGVLGGLFGAEGGMVPHYAEGGAAFSPQSMFAQTLNMPQDATSTFGSSNAGAQSLQKGAAGLFNKPQAKTIPMGTTSQATNPMITGANSGMKPAVSGGDAFSGNEDFSGVDPLHAQYAKPFFGASGGKVPAMVSPGEHRVPKEKVTDVAKGKVNPLKVGETFPGTPKVKGNSYANDVLPKKLSAGDVIIPNNIMQSKDPVRGAAEFVRDVLAKKGKTA